MTLLTPFKIEYDARLVEEAVMLRIAGHPDEEQLRAGRDRIYEIADEDLREQRFRDFHSTWFERLKLGHPVAAALRERLILTERGRRFCVAPAASTQDEGADLHGARSDSTEQVNAVVVIRLRPVAFLDPVGLLAFLRHELTHVADMLDPAFSYQRELPKSAAGPAYDNLVRERYRVLWDSWIDGRLLRLGWASLRVRDKRMAEFAAAFSLEGAEAERKFQQLFDSDSQTHGALVDLALSASGLEGAPNGRARPCPLCRFPTFGLVDGRDARIPNWILEEITSDFPHWRPEQGLCCQCADLYQSREISRQAESVLPRI